MSSIFKIKSGVHKDKYKGVIYLPPKPGETKRRRKEFYGDSKPEVAAKMVEIEYQLLHNIYTDPGNTTVETYLKEWSKTYLEDKEQTTKSLYLFYLEKHIIPVLGSILLKDLMPIHIQDFINTKMKKDKDGNPALKGKTVCKFLVVLNSALGDAVTNRLILVNPCDSVKRPKKEKYENKKVYSEKEMARLLTAVGGTFDEVCIVLAGYLGLRRGEVFGLRWKDIDEKNHLISVKETITRFDKYVTKGPKSESGARTFTAPAFVFDVLNKYKSSLKVIPERICDKYKPQSYSQHFKKLLEKFNLPPTRFHDLRHFNGTIMMRYHVPDVVAAGRMGHADPSTTKGYQHSQNDLDKMAADILNEVYKKSISAG